MEPPGVDSKEEGRKPSRSATWWKYLRFRNPL